MATNLPRPANARPWAKTSSRSKFLVVLAATIPALIAAFALLVLKIPAILSVVVIFLPIQFILAAIVGQIILGKRGRADAALMVFTLFFSSIVAVLLVSVLWSVITEGYKVMSFAFIFQNNNYITPSTELGYGGLGHALLGSVEMVLITSLITVPLGVLVGVYLTETRDKSRGIIRAFVQSLAGLPSVVAGLFIYSAIIVSGIMKPAGILGSLALIPLMLPTVARVCEESLKLVPQDLRSAAIGLGASNFKTFWQVVLPAAKSGVVTAILLGVARILGETAPILLTTIVGSGTNLDPFNGAYATLPSYLFNNLANSTNVSFQRAWGSALVVMIFVALAFGATRILTRKRTARKSR